MAFSIKDKSEATYTDLSRLYQTDLDALVLAHQGIGVLTGCAVTAQGSPDMTVAVAAGKVAPDTGYATVSAGNATITSADGTHPRIDLITAAANGTRTVTAGTPAAAPLPPDIPSGHILLAYVYVPAGISTIDSTRISDRRLFVDRPLIACYAKSTGNQSVSASTDTPVNLSDTDVYDYGDMHNPSSNSPRVTVPVEGLYRISCGYTMPGMATLGRYMEIALQVDGSTVHNRQRCVFYNTQNCSLNLAIDLYLTAGQYVEMIAFHNDTASKNVSNAWLQVHYVGS